MRTPAAGILALALLMMLASAAAASPLSTGLRKHLDPIAELAPTDGAGVRLPALRLRITGPLGHTRADQMIGWIMKAVRVEISSNVLVEDAAQLTLR